MQESRYSISHQTFGINMTQKKSSHHLESAYYLTPPTANNNNLQLNFRIVLKACQINNTSSMQTCP
jgi:hypothetical protein